MARLPRPPMHLSAEAKEFWKTLVADFEITDQAGQKILKVSLEAYDRAQSCRAAIDRDGLQIPDRFGQLKPHPLLSAERDSRSQFLLGLRSLCLDLEPVKAVGRPAGS